jgi:excisionase family DNA binding protein
MDDKKYYTLEEFADMVRVSKQTVSRWGKNGTIKLVRFTPKIVRVPREEIERFADGGLIDPPPE